jgi:hypothetical protein
LVFRHEPLARTGLVDDVDGLVRQQAIVDVLDRQVHRGLQRIEGVLDLMVLLEAGFQAVRMATASAHRRLDDVDLLEAPCQRAILFEDPAVFLEGRRADAAQLARTSTGLIRLEASIVPPEAEPAPMMVWISSMNRMAWAPS